MPVVEIISTRCLAREKTIQRFPRWKTRHRSETVALVASLASARVDGVVEGSSSRTGPLLLTASPELGPELRRYLKQHRAALVEAIRGGTLECGPSVSSRCTSAYDGLLSTLFFAARAAMQERGQWIPMELAAVGSYGRSALSPFSDLDVRLLCEADPIAASPAVEALLYPLWDAGLDIGHQIVTPDEIIELARSDLPTATALLDWRPIAGDFDGARAFVERSLRAVFSGAPLSSFLEHLEASTRGRHERFGDSVFLLEPDVKNGAGGLRDLDVLLWVARARWQIADTSRLAEVTEVLGRTLTQLEAATASPGKGVDSTNGSEWIRLSDTPAR